MMGNVQASQPPPSQESALALPGVPTNLSSGMQLPALQTNPNESPSRANTPFMKEQQLRSSYALGQLELRQNQHMTP